MAKSAAGQATIQDGLHLAVEDEDWVALRGSPAALEGLGRLLIEFAESAGPDVAVLDAPGSWFQSGSLGLTLYRLVSCGPTGATPGADPSTR